MAIRNDSRTTVQRQLDALDEYKKYANVSEACRKAGVGRQTWYDWIAASEEFKQAVKDADESIADRLEVAAIKKAEDGSEQMMQFMLRALRREKYGQKAETDGNLQVTISLDFGENS